MVFSTQDSFRSLVTQIQKAIFSVVELLKSVHFSKLRQTVKTDGIYAELGRHPLHISRKITIAKYYKRLRELPEDRLAKKAFRQLNLNDNNNHYNWVSVANSIRDEFSLDLTESEEKLKNKVEATYSKTLIQNLANSVNQRKKLRTYAKFRTDIKFESYLDSVTAFTIRRNLPQFRFGVHDLEIERARYGRKPLPIEEKYCKLCLDMRIQAVEDEEHFLLYCPSYAEQRGRFFEKLEQMHYNLGLLEDSDKFVWLFSQENNNCIHWLSKFIFSAMKIRKKALESTLHIST